jgi:hypothetical protein
MSIVLADMVFPSFGMKRKAALRRVHRIRSVMTYAFLF